jgi:hypothetical protein
MDMDEISAAAKTAAKKVAGLKQDQVKEFARALKGDSSALWVQLIIEALQNESPCPTQTP